MDPIAAALGAMMFAAVYYVGAWIWSKIRKNKKPDND